MAVPTTPTDTTVDLVVIGSGTGMLAALAAHDLGLSVLIIEKTEYVGGSTALSGGAFWVPGNSVLRDEGADDSTERAAEYLRVLVGDSTDPARWQAYLRHGPAAVDLMRRLTPLTFMRSVGYADYHTGVVGASASGRTCESRPFDAAVLGDDRPAVRRSTMAAPVPMPITGTDYRWMNLMATVPTKGLPRVMYRVGQGVGGKLLGREYVAGGAALAAGLYAGVRRAGMPVWRETSLQHLVRDGESVGGVVVRRGDRDVTVTARRGVVLAAGGFDHEMEWRRQYQSPSLEEWTLGSPGNTGDAIRIAMADAGAGTALLDQAWWFPAVAPLPGGAPKIMLAERSLPGSFIVDGSGERFINEATDYMSFGQEVLARERAGRPVGQMWIIFDQGYRDRYVFAGELFPRMAIPRSWYDAGLAHRASSIEELAQRTGLERLVRTTARFDTLAAAGVDDDFHRGDTAYNRYYGDPSQRPNPNLRPLNQPPFHAVRMVLADLGTCGGIRADGLARALREDGSVIPGLYAIGNTAANAFGNRYPGAGATIGQGIVFGYIAAQHAAGQLPTSP